MKARRFRSILERELGYRVVRQKGSHRRLEAPGLPALTLAFNDGDEIAPGLIRSILVKQVGLSLERAQELTQRG